jgi:hypothetical protein
MAVERLTIDDMSDREFLLILDDCADDDGWADSQTIADVMDLAERRIASSRLSWLARWGAVEREYETTEDGRPRVRKSGDYFYTQRWRMTPTGRSVALGRLRAQTRQSLDKLGDDSMLELTHWLTTRFRRTNETATKLMAREWRYGTSASRDGR